MNMTSFDLNLLRVLDAMFLERSVSRAAARLKLSQPATSNALQRLRVALEDPLFVRTSGGMAPTARANALHRAVSSTLAALTSSLAGPAAFDPSLAKRTFVLAASDQAQLLVLPGLMASLTQYPGLKLQVVPPPRDFPTAELERGEIDLVLGAFDLAPGDRAPRGLKRQLLVSEPYVLVGRKGNPALKLPVKLALDWPQLHVSPRGGTVGTVDRRLRIERNVVLYTPHYLVAPWILASTDLVAALPERIAARFCQAFALTVRPLPIAADSLKVHQLWHPLRHDEPAHQWLRGAVLSAAKSFISTRARAFKSQAGPV